uniref:Transferrin receptor protein 1 n=1 Tax=Canis lupus dingo TaxID=286419 RepID=A0A8C0QUD1_CANLU
MMDQARSAFSTLFGGEPLSYTRFSLARQVDGDNSHVEMKLAADEEENVDNNMRGNHASVPKPKRCNGFICYGTIAVVLFFLIGKSAIQNLMFLVTDSRKSVNLVKAVFILYLFMCHYARH